VQKSITLGDGTGPVTKEKGEFWRCRKRSPWSGLQLFDVKVHKSVGIKALEAGGF